MSDDSTYIEYEKKSTPSITLILFGALIIGILILIITPIIQFKSWFNWWNTHDPHKKYRCF